MRSAVSDSTRNLRNPGSKATTGTTMRTPISGSSLAALLFFGLQAVTPAAAAGISNWRELCQNRPGTVGCNPSAPDDPPDIPTFETRLRAEIASGAGSFWCWTNCIRSWVSVDAIVAEALKERRDRTTARILAGIEERAATAAPIPTAQRILDQTDTTRPRPFPAADDGGFLGQSVLDTEVAAAERAKARAESDRRNAARVAEEQAQQVKGKTVGEIAVTHRGRIGAEGQPLWGDNGLVKAIEEYNFWYNPELVSSRARRGAQWDANRVGPQDVLKVPPRSWVEEWYKKRAGSRS